MCEPEEGCGDGNESLESSGGLVNHHRRAVCCCLYPKPCIHSGQRRFIRCLLDVQRLRRKGYLGAMMGNDSGDLQENILLNFVVMHPLGGIGEGVNKGGFKSEVQRRYDESVAGS